MTAWVFISVPIEVTAASFFAVLNRNSPYVVLKAQRLLSPLPRWTGCWCCTQSYSNRRLLLSWGFFLICLHFCQAKRDTHLGSVDSELRWERAFPPPPTTKQSGIRYQNIELKTSLNLFSLSSYYLSIEPFLTKQTCSYAVTVTCGNCWQQCE